MSIILVVEPYRLLQYAFIAALGDDHDLVVVKSVPETARRADLAIVDAAALREKESLSPVDFESIRDWQVPVVWLDTDIAEVPVLDRLTRIKLPLNQAALQHALMQPQRSPETSVATIPDAIARTDGRPVKKTRVKTAKPSDASGESKQDIVELVDVVEDLAGHGRQIESAKKE